MPGLTDRPDLLPGHRAETIDLAPDRWGCVAGTLVSVPADSDRAVLYVHGFNDYHHCEEMGPRFVRAGYRFYAVDLRGHGRSIRPGRPMAFVDDLGTYFEEIGDALRRIRERDGCRLVVLVGHSTGGLVAPLFVAARGGIDALWLNSPFFEFRASPHIAWTLRNLWPKVGAMRPLHPLPVEPDPRYAWSLHPSFGKGGEWDYDLAWKRPGDLPVRAGWIRAVARGQARVRRGLDLRCPVLVMAAADRGGDAPGFDRSWMKTDTVLDPEACIAGAAKLGSRVVTSRIEDGVHDLVLSIPRVRDGVYEQVFDWLGSVAS